MFIERLKENFNNNEPIFTDEILELFSEFSRAYVFRLIDKALKNEEIIKFDTAVYYIPTKSIIGTSTITAYDVVVKKYIEYKDKVYGVYSGLNLQNMFSFTTQMPNTIEIVTNNESTRCRKIVIKGLNIILHKSRCEINSKNAQAYTVLQLLSEIRKLDSIDNRGKDSLKKYIKDNNIRDLDFISLVGYFPAQTTKNLINSEVLNVFTQ